MMTEMIAPPSTIELLSRGMECLVWELLRLNNLLLLYEGNDSIIQNGKASILTKWI